jgi:hypothetical protein
MKYKVKFRYTTFLEETVEANSPDEAIEKTITERRGDNLRYERYDYTEVEDEEGNVLL